MALIEPIRIEGLREFSRGLRRIGSDHAKGLRLAGNKAAQIVVDTAKPRVPIGPGKGGHAASSVKAASTRTAARVSGGGKKFPYYPWLDFGGRVGPNNSIHRPFLKQGRYIWKSYADRRDRVEEVLREELVRVARGAGFELDQ
jgi:hypothetical protein